MQEILSIFSACRRARALLPSNEKRPLPKKENDGQPANVDRQYIPGMLLKTSFFEWLTTKCFDMQRGEKFCRSQQLHTLRGAEFLADKAATEATVALAEAAKKKAKADAKVAATAANPGPTAMLVSPVRPPVVADGSSVIVVSPVREPVTAAGDSSAMLVSPERMQSGMRGADAPTGSTPVAKLLRDM